MDLSLEGGTYQGHFLVADIAMQTSLPRDETGFFFGPNGLLLLASLPGGRWLSFQDLEEAVDYTGSPLVMDHAPNGTGIPEPHPGQRYPDWTHFGGTSHRVLVFGSVTDTERLAQLGRRWDTRVEISHNPDVNPNRAGVGTGGVVLIRPDGHIGFRFPSADGEAIAALDRHLSSYLMPDPSIGPV
jgi:Aromatic-ring hydroxylase, C-terminal